MSLWLPFLAFLVVCLAAYFFVKRPRPDRSRRGLNVVITGSTKGIGYALASEFAKLGDNVVISARNSNEINEVVSTMATFGQGAKVFGCACDITNEPQCDELARFAVKNLGSIDIWINNAGITAAAYAPLISTPADQIQRVVGTNLIGTLFATKAAIGVMKDQARPGRIFLMEGAGSNGMATPKYATYGVSKAGMVQLTKSLNQELKEMNLLPKISIHTLSPGMVITDLLVRPPPAPRPDPRTLRIFNILCERPSTVASWMVPLIRGVQTPGSSVRFLTPPGVAWRFLTAPLRRNRFFEEKY